MAEFHPASVHFPIAFLILWPVIDIIGLWRERIDVGRVALGVLTLAMLCTLISTVTGQAAFDQAIENGVKAAVLEPHTLNADLIPWLTLIVFLVRSAGVHKFGRNAHLAAVIMGVGLAGFVATVGNSGGNLVFEQGVGVLKQIEAPTP